MNLGFNQRNGSTSIGHEGIQLNVSNIVLIATEDNKSNRIKLVSLLQMWLKQSSSVLDPHVQGDRLPFSW